MTTAQNVKNPHRAGTNQAAGVQETTHPEGGPMTTAYRPTGTERATLELILARRGVRLERATDAFERAECNWRGLETCGPTEFRILRDPAGTGYAIAEPWLVGVCCFTDALNAAQAEQDPNSDADLVVETRPAAE